MQCVKERRTSAGAYLNITIVSTYHDMLVCPARPLMSQADTKVVSARPVRGKKLFLFGLAFPEENLVDRMYILSSTLSFSPAFEKIPM